MKGIIMNMKISKKLIKSTITLIGLFLGLGACYGKLPGKVIIDNESNFDLAITATIFVGDGKYYEHYTDQITAADIDKPLQTDGVLKQGAKGEDNIEIGLVGSQSAIRIPLDVTGISREVINENGNTTELLINVINTDREYDRNDKLTGYFYRVDIKEAQNFPENEQVETMYTGNRYDDNGNVIDRGYGDRYGYGDRRYRYGYGVGGAVEDIGYGTGRAVEDVGYGAGSAVQGVGNAIGNIL